MGNDNRSSIVLYTLLPKGLISRLFGVITRLPVPYSLLKKIIKWYSNKYNVIDEYITPPHGFRSFDDFFTRELKAGARKIDLSKNSAVSPVDARIDEFGTIHHSTILQAKGLTYKLDELIPSENARAFIDGSFITLYLSPGDYHRIHSPVDGYITGFFHVPGKLFTVQDFMVQGLPGLFVKNERIITYIQTDAGIVAVCKIGALNVGKITLAYNDIQSNRTFRRRREVMLDPASIIPVARGDELGTFHLGSTVILIFQKGAITFDALTRGGSITMGKKIGKLRD